jgi:colanic acid/amylovoran biosynthesis glycosyltransferase
VIEAPERPPTAAAPGSDAPSLGRILYIAGTLPALSETFVYREIFALRDRGLDIATASIRAPQRDLGDPRLDALAAEAIPVYGAGPAALLRDAVLEGLAHPLRAARTKLQALRDAAAGRDLTPAQRLKVLWQFTAALALARRVRPAAIRHIHAHMAHVPATIAMYAAHQLGIGFSFTGHANDLFPNRALLAEKLRRARFVACISHWHREFYRSVASPAPERGPAPATVEERLPIIRCGVDVPPAPPARHASPAPPPEAPLRVVSVARLIPKKGLDVLVESIARLAPGLRPLHCRIIGDGPEHARLAALIRQHRLGETVELAGALPNAQVLDALEMADLFVLPCRIAEGGDRDGIPVVLMEAMARGLCAVSGDLPPIRELIRDGQTGVMVPPGDPASLAAAIRILAADPSMRRCLGDAGRAWVADEFSTAVNAPRLIRAFTWAILGAPALAELQPCAA